MALTITDFVEQVDGLTVEDISTKNRERINDALADLTDGPGGGGAPVNNDAILVSKSLGERNGFNSIQAAIDDSETSQGDTIFVEPGDYDETVSVDKEGLTLQSTQGRSQTTIGDLSNRDIAGPVVQVNAANVVVDGFEIGGATGSSEGGQGVDVNGNDNNTDGAVLRNLRVRDNKDRGLVVDRSDDVLIENVVSEDNYDRNSKTGDPPEDGFSSGGEADGITIYYTDNSTLKNVTARNNGDNGIYVKGDDNKLEDIRVDANGDEGLDLSSDGSGVAGGATVKRLTTKGNRAQEVAIEGHSNNVSIKDSSLTVDTTSGSTGDRKPAGINVSDMSGGSVTVESTSFSHDGIDTLAYLYDETKTTKTVNLNDTKTNNSNTFGQSVSKADLSGNGTDDALVPPSQ